MTSINEIQVRALWGYADINAATTPALLEYRQIILDSYALSYQSTKYTEEELVLYRYILVDRLQGIEARLLVDGKPPVETKQ